MEVKVIGQMDNTIDHTFESANRVYDVGGVSPTINTCGGGGLQPKILEDARAIRMVRTEEGKALRKDYERGAIHHRFNEHREMELRTDGVSNTLSTVQKDNYICEKSIVAMRGRNPENPSDRTVGSPTEQRLEPNSQGICNTLTSVQKDNLVMESSIVQLPRGYNNGGEHKICPPITSHSWQDNNYLVNTDNRLVENVYDFYNDNLKSDGVVGTITTGTARNGSGTFGVIEKVGQISNDGSQYGTVISENGISSNLVAGTHGYANNCIQQRYRIRKLTPRECWRLMDFTDEDFEKAAQVNSRTQLYKQAGNSICRNVLVAILGQMILGKEDVYKKE